MTHTKFFLSCLLFLLCLTLSAQGTFNRQQRAAEQFFAQQKGPSLRLKLKSEGRNALLFTSERGHFVLTDKESGDILGYGDGITDEMPRPIRNILSQKRSMSAFAGGLSQKDGDFQTKTSHPFLRPTPVVAPILKTRQHQDAPYNVFCPYWIDNDGNVTDTRCKVGCVATALAQIMISHGRTITLLDTLKGRTTSRFSVGDVLPGGSIDTRIIRPDYASTECDTSAHAAAQLAFWCGMAARMNWGCDESGANVERLVEPLHRVFGYKYAVSVDSYLYTPETWMDMLINEITSGRAVLYAGYIMQMGGHAFVLDGLDGNGLYHVNWGYGGNYDGYFRLDVLNFADQITDDTEPDDELLSLGFACNQQAILLWPDEVDDVLPDTLERTGNEIRVSDIRFEQEPKVGVFTPMTMQVENTTSQTLTTPFEFFTNLPTDTALLEQADFVGLTGVTLQPAEKRTLRVHLMFYESGSRIFHLSPDDKTIVCDTLIDIQEFHAANLDISAPTWKQQDDSTAVFTVDFSNEVGAGRSGAQVTFEVIPANEPQAEGPRHFTYIYLKGGEQTQREVRFTHLKTGQTYTFLVRYPWQPVHTLEFTLQKLPEGIESVSDNAHCPKEIYTPDGRRVTKMSGRGIYIIKTPNGTQKVWKK